MNVATALIRFIVPVGVVAALAFGTLYPPPRPQRAQRPTRTERHQQIPGASRRKP